MVLVRFSYSRHPGEGRDPLTLVIPAQAGIHSPSSSRRRPGSSVCVSIFRANARTDSRPCELRRPSWPPSHFLLLAQEKVTKEKGTLAAAVAGRPARRLRKQAPEVR